MQVENKRNDQNKMKAKGRKRRRRKRIANEICETEDKKSHKLNIRCKVEFYGELTKRAKLKREEKKSKSAKRKK